MGKGGESSKTQPGNNATEKKEVLIEGVFYDVTDMKHPGGSIINFYAGKGFDGTQAFNQFHIRSPQVKKYMNSLPHRKAEEKELKQSHPLPGQEKLLADFEKFTQELEKEGLFDCSIPHTIYRLLEVFFLYAAGIYLLRENYLVLGIIFMAFGQGRCGWLMHEGGHYSMTGKIQRHVDAHFQVYHLSLLCLSID